jgi:ubiquinone biosynthesis protein COQ4
LTGLPPTVLGELALKWLELMQTGLPLAALSATGGSLRLSSEERDVLWNVYFPWAIRVGGNMKENGLMCVYYEEEMETELSVLRERIGVESAPIVNGL